jgi:hypothetical protein
MTQPDEFLSIWERLAVPFPDDEVKQRPGAAKWDHKDACQGKACRQTRDPEAHVQFSYVDARAVAQRLDDVLTPEGWDFTCSTIPGSDVVKGTLRIGDNIREDHGYPNSERDEEPIKAATSDALKRCAVMFGVGRHLYEDNRPTSRQRSTNAPSTGRSAPVAAAPVRSSTAVPDDFADLDFESLSPTRPSAPALSGTVAVTDRVELSEGENWCPVHGLAWVLKPAGISKTGAPYDAFYACSSKDKPWCKEKPTKQWVDAHLPKVPANA